MAKTRSTSFTLAKDTTTWQGALTNSKRPQSHVQGVYPTHLTRGNGVYVYDDNGAPFIDYICGLGSSLLGHSPFAIKEAIKTELENGISLSLSSTIEVECAEMIKANFQMIDRLKFVKNGSDACLAAIRFARAFTKRSKILVEGYHGAGDGFVSMTPPRAGVTDTFDFHLLDDCVDKDCAAVIIEPIMTDLTKERIEWLHALRKITRDRGIVLIFDEIITGMRFPGFSVSRFLGIEPDIICLGKAIASGMPLAIVGGRRDIMDNDQVFYSMTYAGERLSLAACMATIKEVRKQKIDTLWETGMYFLQRFNKLSDRIKIEGYPTRGVFRGGDLDKALFFQEAVKSGILFGPSFFYGFCHPKYDDFTLTICQDILGRLHNGDLKLEGKMPQSPFAQQIREGTR